MPLETVVDVPSDANVEASGIGIAANDVDEPGSSASHAIATRIDRASLDSWEFCLISVFRTQFLPAASMQAIPRFDRM